MKKGLFSLVGLFPTSYILIVSANMKTIAIHFILATIIHLVELTLLFGIAKLFPRFSWAMLSIYVGILIPLSYLIFFFYTARFKTLVSLIQIPVAGFASFAACGITYTWYEDFVESLEKGLEILISSTVALILISLIKVGIDYVTVILGFELKEMKIKKYWR
ncbi:MAG: hypothetical protein RIC95_02785 [Vicingaceae bacterium]